MDAMIILRTLRTLEMVLGILVAFLLLESLKFQTKEITSLLLSTSLTIMLVPFMFRLEDSVFHKNSFNKSTEMTITIFGSWMYAIGAMLSSTRQNLIEKVILISCILNVMVLVSDTLIKWCTNSKNEFYHFYPVEVFMERLREKTTEDKTEPETTKSDLRTIMHSCSISSRSIGPRVRCVQSEEPNI